MNDGDDVVQVIMPSSITKYQGCVYRRTDTKTMRYKAAFTSENTKKRKSVMFDTFDAGFSWVKEQNQLENNNRVKNIIYKTGNEYECELTNGIRMLFDGEDIGLVQSHTWFATSHGYVRTSIRGSDGVETEPSFHAMLIGEPPEGLHTDHKDRNKANNKKTNLRFATVQINMLNRGVSNNNTSGTKGVYLHVTNNTRNAWIAKCVDENGHEDRKYFSIPELGDEEAKRQAIAYRKMKEETLLHYIEALQYEM